MACLQTMKHRLYQDEDLGFELAKIVYAFVSTTIEQCLSILPSVFFRKRKGVIELHLFINLRGSIPTTTHL